MPLGVVPTAGRGSLPFALWHGESLVAVASWALAESGARLLDFDTPWSAVVAAGVPLVVHDPLCPTTPVSFLARAAAAVMSASAVAPDHPVPAGPVLAGPVLAGPVLAGVRPVTDTVKQLRREVTPPPSSGRSAPVEWSLAPPSAGLVGDTVDRSSLLSLASPVVLHPRVLTALPDWPDLTDLPALVAGLGERFEVSFLEAPAEGRRIVDESDLRLLEATTPAR